MSTLTPEQQRAYDKWVRNNAADYAKMPIAQAAFLAGMRYQHERTREAAAKVADLMNDEASSWLYAHAIRALTLDEC